MKCGDGQTVRRDRVRMHHVPANRTSGDREAALAAQSTPSSIVGAGKNPQGRRSPHPHDLPVSLVEDARDGAIE
jgi:hypothetical protein